VEWILMPVERTIVVEMIDQAMVDRLRRKTPEQRLALSLEMWRCARDRLMHLLTTQHPVWNEKQILAEFRRRMLGPE
jgi:hypothetical protein